MDEKVSAVRRLAHGGLSKEDVDLENAPGNAVKRWARGELSLKEIKGYTSEELYCISQQAYTLFLNGKLQDAQIVFEGLVALDPRNEYYYRALGVVYHRLGDADRALRQFNHAITVAPKSPAGYVNRAEVHIARRDRQKALLDLGRAIQVARDTGNPVVRKAYALRDLVSGKAV